MHALLHELERHTLVRRRRWMAASAVAILATGATLGLATAGEDRGSLCSGGDGQIATFWNDDARRRVAESLAGFDAPYARATADRVTEILDRYEMRWTANHRDACEATHVRGPNPPVCSTCA